MLKKNILSLSFLAAASLLSMQAEVKLPAIFSDNMVLQQQTAVPFWGKADPGEKIELVTSWNLRNYVVYADDKGDWKVSCTTPAASFTPYQVTIMGSSSPDVVHISNILVGEVWHCAGQSNMAFPVGNHQPEIPWQTGMLNEEQVLADANYPAIRLFTIKGKIATDGPVFDVKGSWKPATPENVADFSAVGYIFGLELFKELNVPIGLINSSVGATLIESWTDPKIMKGNKIYDYARKRFGAENVESSRRHDIPGALWNGMIAPITGYAIKGNIWYQGCGNAGNFQDYPEMFRNLVYSWRTDWEQPDMPFYYVQIAPFKDQPAGIREAQLEIFKSDIDNIGMVVTADCGDSLDIHPRNKEIPGKRLARWALNRDYGKDIPVSGPIYNNVIFHGNKAIVSFDHIEGGMETPDGEPLKGFMIAGANKKFYPAKAEIRGDVIVVYSDKVEKPMAVRYGFENFFRTNLYNSAKLPASPFRTDSWPLVKPEKKK